MWAKQSTAATLIVGPILDSAGAEYTGAVIGDLSISKNGGTLTALAAAATLIHIANGQYTLVMTTGNLDTLGRLQITCNKSTYQMPPIGLNIVPAMVFDSMVLGTDRFDANVTHVGDTSQTAGDIYASQVAIAGYIDTEVSAIKAKTDNLPSDPADQSAVEAAITAATSPLATQASVNTIDDFLDTEIAAIKTKTDQLTFTTANKVDSTAVLDSAARVKLDATQPDYAPATATALTTVGNNVTAILEDTGTTIPAQITALNNLSSAQVVSALGTGTWATSLPWNAAWDAEVQSEVQDAIEVNNLDHLVKIAVDTNFATTVHLDSIIGHIADNGTTATFSRTTDSLEAIRDNQTAGSGASLSDIIAGVQSVSGAIVEAQNSATLSIRIGDTWTQDIESLGDLTDKTVSFALKKRASDADTAAIVFIVEGTGLTKLNGAATTAGWGSITILDEVSGDIRLRLESNATSLLTSGSYVDAVKVLENGDDRTLRNAGRTVVSAGVIADIT